MPLHQFTAIALLVGIMACALLVAAWHVGYNHCETITLIEGQR